MSRSVFLVCCVWSIFIASLDTAEAVNPCSVRKMREAYNEMKRANCKNCDKYFHCKGNYNAVHRCSGILKISTAVALSNARELFGGNSGSRDSAADQVANKFGREGGNCEGRYLKAVKCYWRPSSKKCQK